MSNINNFSLTFKNFAAFTHAELNLYPLTLISGPNNSGKTYLAYAIYSLFKNWRSLIQWQIPNEVQEELLQKATATIDLKESFLDQWEIILKEINQQWQQRLPEFLATMPSRFKNAELALNFTPNNTWQQKHFTWEKHNASDKIIAIFEKTAGSTQVNILITEKPALVMMPIIRECLLEIILADDFPAIFMASAERTATAIFRSELVTQMSQGSSKRKRRYALPIEDNITFINDLDDTAKQESSLLKKHPELLDAFKDITGGQYMTKDGSISFTPNKTLLKLDLNEASSTVRSMSLLWFWLNHEAKTGDILMIDEPELNLHPMTQRKVARFLARLVNSGIHVIATTHSDYLVKEFNTLLMLHGNYPHYDVIREKYHYQPEEQLKLDNVALYMTDLNEKGKSVLQLAEKDIKLGLDASTFDETIDEMNQLQDEILYDY